MDSTLHKMALLEIGLPKSIAKALRLPTNSPKRQQLRVLKTLLKKAKYTQFGQHYGFENILGQRDPRRQFRELVPAHDYNKIYQEWWNKTLDGTPDVCWPGMIKYFALSSGTSEAASKYIPITQDLMKGNRVAMIKQLLSLTRPVEHKVVYGGENGPHSNAILPRTSGGGNSSRGRSPGRTGSGGKGSHSSQAATSGSDQRILRTVYLPTAQAEALGLKCEALAAQLAEQKQFAAERVAALQEDRAIRERDAAAHAAALGQTAEELAHKLQAAEEALRRATKDFILARQQRDAAEQAAAAAAAAAAAERQQAEAALRAAEQRAAAELQQQRQELEGESRAATEVGPCPLPVHPCVQRCWCWCWQPGLPAYPQPPLLLMLQALRAELARREEELLNFETLHKLIRGQLEARVSEAERQATRAAARARDVQQRRAHEMEGWAADVSQLRKRIAAVDRRLKQMALVQRLPDDERRDAVLARHAR